MKKHIFITYYTFFLFHFLNAQVSYKAINDFTGTECEGAVSFVAGGRAFIGLGQIGANQYTKSFYRYDQNKDTWEAVASFPAEGRAYAIAFVADGKAYVGFGERIDAVTNKVTRVYADLYEYDPITDAWSVFDKGSQSSMSGLGQASVFTVKENGRMVAHITGGRNLLGVQGAWYSYTPSLNQWNYPVNNQVELKRYGASALSVNNKGYIFGGKDDSKTWDKVLQYDPTAAVSKLTVASTQTALAKNNATAIANGSNIFMAYGDKPTVTQFNTSNKQFSDIGDVLKFKGTRQGMISFLYLNKIFIGLGRSVNGSFNTDLYTISGLTTDDNDVFELVEGVKVFPNPANYMLNVEYQSNKDYEIVLCNITGQILKKATIANGNGFIDISNLENGLIICELWQQGHCLVKKKIVVLH